MTGAIVVAASGSGASALPEYCRVDGRISPVDPTAPNILFRVALPTAWNSKAVMFGGGGFNGSIPNVAGNVPAGPANQLTPLGRGYATFASDSGHQANEFGSQDGRWGLNDEATRNFAGDALKKTRDAATFLIKARYAAGKPVKAYFAGGSTGGREATKVIQLWPEDWDGAIASLRASLAQNPDGTWMAELKSPPVDGKANAELIALIARHFGCSKAAVTIKTGASGRRKLIKVET